MKKSCRNNIPPAVWGVFWAFLAISAGNFVSQFMTLYLTEKLQLEANYSGTVVSLAGIASLPGIILGGRLSDSWGVKKTFTLFQILAILVTVVLILVEDPYISPIMVILNSLFISAIHPVCNATIFAATDETNRQESLSLFMMGMYIGYMISDLGCSIGFAKYYRLIFVCEAIMKTLSIFIFNFTVNIDVKMIETPVTDRSLITDSVVEDGTMADRKEGTYKKHQKGLAYILFKNPALLIFSISCCLFSMVYTQSAYSLPIQMNATFGEKGSFYYGIIMIINAILIAVGTKWINMLVKGHDTINLILIATILVGCGMGMLYFNVSVPFYITSVIFWSVAFIIDTPYAAVYISDYAPKNMLGRFSSWIKIVTGAGYALGPVFFGAVITDFGLKQVWKCCMIITGINVVLLIGIKVLSTHKRDSII